MMFILMMGMMTASSTLYAQAPAAAPAAAATELAPSADAQPAKAKPTTGLGAVIFGSGWLGVVLWLALFGSGIAAIYFAVDCSILLRPQKIMPHSLISNVKTAMAEGDVMKALKSCEVEPGPLANILTAGFSHVEEGFEVIQESIGAASDLETERLMQRLTWISVCSNLAPMLGLLGTVQGMIMCFETLALWTTAGGLVVAIPAITAYYSLRNNANRLILRMQAMTMELIKDLRNVEVVND
jgi:biopolymer transport protein ExbB